MLVERAHPSNGGDHRFEGWTEEEVRAASWLIARTGTSYSEF